MQLKPWITAARLKTLPLAVSNVFLGSFLAFTDGKFSIKILLLGLLTAIMLQVLSNYANDYGDFVSKADENRVSKYQRALQSGSITASQMKIALALLSVLIFITGIYLVFTGLQGMSVSLITAFIIAGIFCIIAAITYTVGKKPYGYMGLGDINVFLFFGIVAVCGMYILHTKMWNAIILLPAAAFGLLSTGVLNINNIRDEQSDRQSGKGTLVVKMGIKNAKIYHVILVTTAIILMIIFTVISYTNVWQWLFLITIPLFIKGIYNVWTGPQTALDDELRNLSLTILLFVVLFGAGLILPY